MKKWAYLVSGIVIGALVATSGSAFAAQVKSLVGQKVTGELTVVVNGKELADKGAVINGKTNAPVRALSEALGANLKVEGKTINITTDASSQQTNTAGTASRIVTSNPYIGESKESLEKLKNSLENDILAPNIKERDQIKSIIEQSKASGGGEITQRAIETAEKNLATYESNIEKYTKQLEQVNEALKELEN